VELYRQERREGAKVKEGVCFFPRKKENMKAALVVLLFDFFYFQEGEVYV
jgi:hypothetical protein